jgi:hypothetical protein
MTSSTLQIEATSSFDTIEFQLCATRSTHVKTYATTSPLGVNRCNLEPAAISETVSGAARRALSVESEVGRGSTFRFTARFALQESPPPEAAIDMEISAISRSGVDDNATNRRILHDVLVGWRMKPVLTEGGRAALDVLEETKTRTTAVLAGAPRRADAGHGRLCRGRRHQA